VRTVERRRSGSTLTTKHYAYSPELSFLGHKAPGSKGTGIEAVWFAGAPIAQEVWGTHGQTKWTFTDHLGTPLLQTNSSKAVVWRAEYEPYGNVYAMRNGTKDDQPLRFAGQERLMDSSNGSGEERYNIFRWYRSGWGRYTQADPKALKGGYNLFRYTNNNPAGLVDPLGLAAKCASGKCADCPKGLWVSTAGMVERAWKFGPVDVGGIVFSGVFICPSNPYFNVPFTSFCGFGAGPSKPHGVPTTSGGGAGAEVGVAGITCVGYKCREDLEGAEFGGFVQTGPAFGFGELGGGGKGCWGAGVGEGGGFALGGLACKTVIGDSLGGVQ
jgi:RHS repeat-associated protein